MTTLNVQEIQALVPVIDAGIKALGIQTFHNEGGARLQVAINKLQKMSDEAQAAAQAAARDALKEKLKANGEKAEVEKNARPARKG